jgi:hypothetical protein
VVTLLATPNSRDYKGSPGAGSRERGGHQASLPADLALLPTPMGRDKKGGDAANREGSMSLPEFVETGAFMRRPSRGGRKFSDVPLPLQWNQDATGSG